MVFPWMKNTDDAGGGTDFLEVDRQTLTFDQEGANTQFVYDDRGLVEMRTDPKGNKNHYQYTAAGQLKKATDRKC